jgi:hypothetical protein
MFMTRKEMNEIVAKELEGIPDNNQPQKMLRMIYTAARRSSLGKNAEGPKTAMEVLEYSLAFVRKDHPDAQLSHNGAFFAGR